MAARSIASLTLSFGLVNIPVKLYSATESSASVRFNLLAKDGSRLKQQYVSDKDGKVVERAEMVKGYEFEKDHFVIFQPDELKKLEETTSHVIEIVAFVPEKSVDPIYYDKAYYLAPDKRGGKPYALLLEAMRASGRCALARWAWKAKQYVVQVRPAEDGLVLQQLLYAEEVRSFKELDIEQVDVSKPELALALQLIDQIAQEAYDPAQFKDDEHARVLAAIDAKIAGKQVVEAAEHAPAQGAQVIDLMEALRASLGGAKAGAKAPAKPVVLASNDDAAAPPAAADPQARKGARRAPASAEKVEEAAPAPARPSPPVTDAQGASLADAPYTLRHIQQMLGLTRSAIAALIDAGFVAPGRGPRNEWRFSFHDVVLLRTAHQLRAARIPPRALMRSLRQLRARLPRDLPLAGLRIRAVGNDVAVLGAGAVWEAGSGQMLLDLEVAPAPGGALAFIQAEPGADEVFARAEALEGRDARDAEAGYRRAIELARDHADSYINLGALLCEQGRAGEAVVLYDGALRHCPEVALIHFNRAVALEDAGRREAALASYRRSIALDAEFADAHYNAARLLDEAGDAQAALRHYSAYRRLQRRRGK